MEERLHRRWVAEARSWGYLQLTLVQLRVDYQTYKFTKSVFETYCENDSLVWTKCDLYDSVTSDVITASSKTTPVKKRSRSSFEVDTPEAPRVVKTICLLTDSSEESSEESGD